MYNYDHKTDWYYEGEISKKIVLYLIKNGYEIIKDNSNNISTKGEDIIARINGITEIIEVKGYPTNIYTNGTNRGKPKPTNPKLQAKHWFTDVLISCIFNYKKHKMNGNFKLAIGLPLNDRYLELIGKVEDFFYDYKIDMKIYLVNEGGEIIERNLNISEGSSA